LQAQPAIPANARVVAIHQPHYLPWLGLIAKIASSDVFVFLDDVQFEKNGWQNRTRYSTSSGLKYLSLPVRQGGIVSQQKTIREIEIADSDAPAKHWKTLAQRYGKRPGWPLVAGRLEQILTARHERLISLCRATTELTLDIFRIRPKFVSSSQLAVHGMKGDRVVNLVRAVGATHYLSGTGARAYLDVAAFAQADLALLFQEFTHPVYGQSTGRTFEPAAFALEWVIEESERAIDAFHAHLRSNPNQPPRCLE
jgi:hypothetical protein